MDTFRTLVRLQGVRFAYPGRPPVLQGVDLQLAEGQKLGLIGPNGSGKTTLFHLIMGLLKPSAGRIELLGRPRLQEPDFREARRHIGLLFQDPDDQLFCPTVLEDVAFGPLNQGKSIPQARRIAEDTLQALGLGDLADRLTYRLSGGEKRLVSLATVLAMHPRVLLLDEPTNGLDRETTTRVVDILRGLDLAYIFISHNMDFILQTTDSILCMVDGRIRAEADAIPHTHTHVHGFGRIPHEHDSGGQPARRRET